MPSHSHSFRGETISEENPLTVISGGDGTGEHMFGGETINAERPLHVFDMNAPEPGVTDHGALTGLADNDHPQYQLVSTLPARKSLAISAASFVVPNATPTFPAPFGAANVSSIESTKQGNVPFACTLRNLYVTTAGAAGAGGSIVCTLRKNGADTAVVVTIAANSVAGVYSDTANSVALAAGDSYSLRVNNSTGVSTPTMSVALEMDS